MLSVKEVVAKEEETTTSFVLLHKRKAQFSKSNLITTKFFQNAQ